MASGCGAVNMATHFVLASFGCATPFVPTCCCCVSGTLGSPNTGCRAPGRIGRTHIES